MFVTVLKMTREFIKIVALRLVYVYSMYISHRLVPVSLV